MFQMIETSRTEYPTTATIQKVPGARPDGRLVFRDKPNMITVTHDYYHRGGSLYGTGQVQVRNNRTGESFTYHTTTPPIDAEAAANKAWYVRAKIGYTA